MRRWTLALFMVLLSMSATQAAGLWLPKNVYYYGETVTLDYDVEGAWFNRINLADVGGDGWQEHSNLQDLLHYTTDPPQGRLSVDTRDLVEYSVGGRFEGDSTRKLFAFHLKVRIEDTNDFRKVAAYFWVLRPQKTWPGVLHLDRTRIFQGQDIEVTIDRLDDVLADNAAHKRRSDEGDSFERHVLLRVVRLGQFLPGGALLADEVVGEQHLSKGMDRISSAEADRLHIDSLVEGNYELQLIGVTGILLDRAAFTIAPPPWQGSMRLEPDRGGAYPYDEPPKVFLDLEFEDLSTVLEGERVGDLRIQVLQMLDADVGIDRNHASGYYLLDSLNDGQAALDLQYTSGGLYPGPHELWFEVPSSFERSFVVDRLLLTLGGDYAYARGKRQDPPLYPEDISRSLLPQSQALVGSPLVLSIELPDGIDPTTRQIWASMHYRATFGFDCSFLVEAEGYLYQYGRMAVDASGQIAFPAPPVPERWELRLWEPDEWNEPVYLGRSAFDTYLPALAGALSWAQAPRVGAPLSVHYEIPENLPFDHFEVHLLRSAERFPEGETASARLVSVADIDESRSGVVELPALWSPGPYELHLKADSGFRARTVEGIDLSSEPYVFDRLSFDLTYPQAPSLPAAYAYVRAPELDPLPAEDDAKRGLAVWWPAFDDCEEPSFPTPPKLLVTELWIGDPEDPSDDRYEQAAAVFPGHPYFIEARFAEAPPEERYRVHLGDGRRVEVWRTGDPLIYRSELVSFMPEAME